MPRDLPTGTVTFLFTDIEGSTRLLHALGAEEYATALAEHRRLVREAVAAHDGVEVDTQGDAFFTAFPTAEGAAEAALRAKHALDAGPISVRIGLHTGTPTVTGEGYVGIDVHRGARIAALAHGGPGRHVSHDRRLARGASTRDLGLHRLKDFDGAVLLLQLGRVPPLRTPGSIDLPIPATRFLGRERELFQAVSLVYERDPRMLTILGPGGTGKTRFALELTRLLADEADGGSIFVALAPLRDPELVLPTIGDRLGAGSGGDPDAIAARISGKRTHLLLDNLEHLLPDTARPLAELGAAAPELRIAHDEPRAAPDPGRGRARPPPARRGRGGGALPRASARRPARPHRGRRCRRPLRPPRLPTARARARRRAYEAPVPRRPPRPAEREPRPAEGRARRRREARDTARDHRLVVRPARQREQLLFARLSVFRGGCPLESAEVVCDADLDVLASLLDKSLVRRRTGRLGEERYWILGTIREFAGEQLEASGEANSVRRRHAELMLEIALSAHLTEDDDERFRLPIVLAEEQDMRAAMDWASDTDVELALALVVALENFWNVHAHQEVVRRLDDLLPRAGSAPPELRAAAFRVRGGLLHVDGDFDACDTWCARASRCTASTGTNAGSPRSYSVSRTARSSVGS